MERGIPKWHLEDLFEKTLVASRESQLKGSNCALPSHVGSKTVASSPFIKRKHSKRQ